MLTPEYSDNAVKVQRWAGFITRTCTTCHVIGALFLLGCAGTRPSTLGPTSNGTLAACPTSPNCVVSLADADGQHRIAPLEFRDEWEDAYERLASIVEQTPRTTIVERRGPYLYAEFRSRIFRFVDDVEFLFVPDGQLVHVRSASRLGHSDLGVNRKRIEAIRQQF